MIVLGDNGDGDIETLDRAVVAMVLLDESVGIPQMDGEDVRAWPRPLKITSTGTRYHHQYFKSEFSSSVGQAQIQTFPLVPPRTLAGAEPLEVDVGKLGDLPEHARRDRLASLVAVLFPMRDSEQQGHEQATVFAEIVTMKLDEAIGHLESGVVVGSPGHARSPKGRFTRTRVAPHGSPQCLGDIKRLVWYSSPWMVALGRLAHGLNTCYDDETDGVVFRMI